MSHLPEARREQLWETHYRQVIDASITAWFSDSDLLTDFLEEQPAEFCSGWPEAKIDPKEALIIAINPEHPVKQRLNALEALRHLFETYYKDALETAATAAANEYIENVEAGVDEGDD